VTKSGEEMSSNCWPNTNILILIIPLYTDKFISGLLNLGLSSLISQVRIKNLNKFDLVGIDLIIFSLYYPIFFDKICFWTSGFEIIFVDLQANQMDL